MIDNWGCGEISSTYIKFLLQSVVPVDVINDNLKEIDEYVIYTNERLKFNEKIIQEYDNIKIQLNKDTKFDVMTKLGKIFGYDKTRYMSNVLINLGRGVE